MSAGMGREIRVEEIYGTGNAIFGSDLAAQRSRAPAHIRITDGGVNGLRQRIHGETLSQDWTWTYAEGVNPPSPVRLIGQEWDDHRGYPGAETFGGGSRAAMVNDGCHAREKPIVRRLIDNVEIIRHVGAAQSVPTSEQHATLTSFGQCVNHEFCALLGVAARHAAKADVNWRWTRLQKIYEVFWRVPIRRAVEEPIAGHVDPVSPIQRPWTNAGTVGVEQWPGILVHSPEWVARRKGWEFEHALAKPIRRTPHHQPEELTGEVMCPEIEAPSEAKSVRHKGSGVIAGWGDRSVERSDDRFPQLIDGVEGEDHSQGRRDDHVGLLTGGSDVTQKLALTDLKETG